MLLLMGAAFYQISMKLTFLQLMESIKIKAMYDGTLLK